MSKKVTLFVKVSGFATEVDLCPVKSSGWKGMIQLKQPDGTVGLQ